MHNDLSKTWKSVFQVPLLLVLFLSAGAWGDCVSPPPHQPLGKRVADGWGYGYDTLLSDLARWSSSPHVRQDSIGQSVQGRTLWELSVFENRSQSGPAGHQAEPKPLGRVYLHARTHPQEVQSSLITRELIDYLLSADSGAAELRQSVIFHFLPMLNPDGVEGGIPRNNAHGVDLESNWDSGVMEPESQALRDRYLHWMGVEPPIGVTLNLHADSHYCSRFFIFHHAVGTSERFVEQEKVFIRSVRSHFPDSIMDWNFLITWTSGTGSRYPEGFIWNNYREQVMALTYEDSYCGNASSFDRTARALAWGARDYLEYASAPVLAFDAMRRPFLHPLFARPEDLESWLQRHPSHRSFDFIDATGRRYSSVEALHRARYPLRLWLRK